jgi:hypothetical protein
VKASSLIFLNFHFLCARMCCLDVVFLSNVNSDSKRCPPILEAVVGLHVHTHNFRPYSLLSVGSSCITCPSARCPLPSNAVCRDAKMFRKRSFC